MYLNDTDRAGIRTASNYRHFRDDLLAFDYKRFRGLGAANTSKFIAHAVKVCDAYKVYHYDAVLQVMKTMCFLGTHMMDDPRFEDITSTLKMPTHYGDTRIENFNILTQRFLKNFAGPKLEYYRLMLNAFLEALEQQMAPRTAREHVLVSLPIHLRPQIEGWRPYLLRSTQHASDALDLKDEGFQTFCLVAAAILGHGFYRDPLYPWVQDLAGENKVGTLDTRPENINHFISKRIRKQLTVLENYYGI